MRTRHPKPHAAPPEVHPPPRGVGPSRRPLLPRHRPIPHVLAPRAATALPFACALFLLLVPAVAAQATPAPAFPGQTVDPSECRVTPRPTADFVALAELTPTSASPVPRGSGPPPAGGIPATPDVIVDVLEAVLHYTACSATRDTARITALWTDGFLRRALGGTDLQTLLTPAGQATPVQLPDIGAIRVLPDGRLLVEVATGRGAAPETIAFIEEAGRYLVDDLFQPSAEARPVASAPTPAISVAGAAPPFFLALFRVTLAPGAILTVDPKRDGVWTQIFVESGGPATATLDGAASVFLPPGSGDLFINDRRTAVIGRLAFLSYRDIAAYRVVNNGEAPLVLIWMEDVPEGGAPNARAALEQNSGVTVEPLGPIENPPTPTL